jgi:hypothetical protein
MSKMADKSRKDIGVVASVNANSISVGDGFHEAARVSHRGYPGAGPTMAVPEGAPLKYSDAKKAMGAPGKKAGKKAGKA